MKEDKQKSDKIPDMVSILGINIHPITKKDFEKKIVYFLKDGQQHYIVTTNPEFIITAATDREFKKIINYADLSIADGNGLIWASHFLARPVKVSSGFTRQKAKAYRKRKIRQQLFFTLAVNLLRPSSSRNVIPERLSGSDIIFDICRITAENDHSLFLLGGEKDVSLEARLKLEKMFPEIIISGIKGGFIKDSISDEELVETVNKAKPDVLFISLGHPYQEKWIFRNLDKMPTVKIAVGIGGSLDFLSGKIRRAPEWMQKINLEWLYRLIQEPRRYQRIKRAVYEFPKLVYQHKIVETERAKEEKDNQKINSF
ncbi:MAG: WecB/TagA/CpsF family glycosyltransferase [Candidatus Moranbacteria bacterium]|nr:WecB/TagA/CpsF family glycosyltransferase [Candidatus Moranbacteria bacterium]